MNFFTICFLAAFCAVQVLAYNPLDQLRASVQKSKSNVQTIMSDLKRYRNNLEYTTGNQLSNLKIQSMTNINNFVNPALTQIRSDVDAAKEKGKDVENCYTNAKDNLRTISQTGFSALDQCQNKAKQILRVQLDALDAAYATGNQYINQLDQIFLKCYTSNISQMQTCIALQLGTVNQSIRTYENMIDTLKRDAQNGANQANLSEMSCNNDAVSTVRSGTTDVRIAASKCLN